MTISTSHTTSLDFNNDPARTVLQSLSSLCISICQTWSNCSWITSLPPGLHGAWLVITVQCIGWRSIRFFFFVDPHNHPHTSSLHRCSHTFSLQWFHRLSWSKYAATMSTSWWTKATKCVHTCVTISYNNDPTLEDAYHNITVMQSATGHISHSTTFIGTLEATSDESADPWSIVFLTKTLRLL